LPFFNIFAALALLGVITICWLLLLTFSACCIVVRTIKVVIMETSYLASYNKPEGSEKISETIEFPKAFAIWGNFAVAFWILLDIVGFWFFNPIAGLLFLVATLIGIYGVLKFLGCLRPCYHCKKCTYGLGRLAALYFGKRSLKDYKETYGIVVAIFFYILLGPFPIAILLISAIQAFTVLKAAVLLSLLITSVYSGFTWRTTHRS
jgi:hypothetical protein